MTGAGISFPRHQGDPRAILTAQPPSQHQCHALLQLQDAWSTIVREQIKDWMKSDAETVHWRTRAADLLAQSLSNQEAIATAEAQRGAAISDMEQAEDRLNRERLAHAATIKVQTAATKELMDDTSTTIDLLTSRLSDAEKDAMSTEIRTSQDQRTIAGLRQQITEQCTSRPTAGPPASCSISKETQIVPGEFTDVASPARPGFMTISVMEYQELLRTRETVSAPFGLLTDLRSDLAAANQRVAETVTSQEVATTAFHILGRHYTKRYGKMRANVVQNPYVDPKTVPRVLKTRNAWRTAETLVAAKTVIKEEDASSSGSDDDAISD